MALYFCKLLNNRRDLYIEMKMFIQLIREFLYYKICLSSAPDPPGPVTLGPPGSGSVTEKITDQSPDLAYSSEYYVSNLKLRSLIYVQYISIRILD